MTLASFVIERTTMPTYEYLCNACGHEFEQFQSIKAAPIKKCPACGKNSVARKIGIGGAVIFKGGGFYETDYRSDSYKKAEESEMGKAKPTSDAKSETTSTPAKTTDATKDAAAKPAAPAAAPATPSAEKHADVASKATHPSRVGRGIGNLLGGSSLGAPSKSSLGGPSFGASPSQKSAAKQSGKPATKATGHPSGKQAGKQTGVPRRTAG
ncbi:MAG: zinc ribbon domain-containing protein [Phycisphaerales bacterium]